MDLRLPQVLFDFSLQTCHPLAVGELTLFSGRVDLSLAVRRGDHLRFILAGLMPALAFFFRPVCILGSIRVVLLTVRA